MNILSLHKHYNQGETLNFATVKIRSCVSSEYEKAESMKEICLMEYIVAILFWIKNHAYKLYLEEIRHNWLEDESY